MNSRLPPFLALAAPLLLLGCNDPVVVLCPTAAVLADTATETLFRPGAPADPSGEAFTAYLTGAKTECTFDKTQGQTFSSLTLNFHATRAPSRDAASYSLTYFVAINQAERVINKQMHTVRFDFAPGATTINVEEDVGGRITLTLENGHLPTDYQLLSGFQITDAQRAYNQKMGRYLP